MEKFKQAAKENRVEKVVKHYLKYTVLIIDELCEASHNSSYGKLFVMRSWVSVIAISADYLRFYFS